MRVVRLSMAFIALVGIVVARPAEGQPTLREHTSSRVVPSPSTLESYAPSLGIGNPRGQLVRVPRPDSTMPRSRAFVDTVGVALRRVGAAAPTTVCPMPVATQDSTALAPMPVISAGATATPRGFLIGCVNSLAEKR